MEILSKDSWVILGQPGGTPDFTCRSFQDLLWQGQAAYYHASRLLIAEAMDAHRLHERRGELANDHAWIILAREPRPALRFEFQALLGAAYSFLNILTKVTTECLTERESPSTGAMPSFRKLEKVLLNNIPDRHKEKAKTLLALRDEAMAGCLRDVMKEQGLRDQLAHRLHLRCRPAQLARSAPPPVQVTLIDDRNIKIASRGEGMVVACLGRWDERVVAKEFLLTRAAPAGAAPGWEPATETVLMLSGPQDELPTFGEIARNLMRLLMELGASFLSTLGAESDGKRQEAVLRMTANLVAPTIVSPNSAVRPQAPGATD